MCSNEHYFVMLHGIPEFDLYYVAYLKDDPAKEPIATSYVPLAMNYLHPLLFIGPFLPFLILGWRRIDSRLRAICLTLVPLVLLSNLCFGWMYESRNYMPLVPLLATMAGQALMVAVSPTRRTA